MSDRGLRGEAADGAAKSLRDVRARAAMADHRWPSNHAAYMPEPCAEILTEWLYPMAADVLMLLDKLEVAHREGYAAAMRDVVAMSPAGGEGGG